MDTACVRENPSPKWPHNVQYLHFRYLKLLVIKQRAKLSYTPCKLSENATESNDVWKISGVKC